MKDKQNKSEIAEYKVVPLEPSAVYGIIIPVT